MYDDLVGFNFINKAMFLGDSSGPVAAKISFQWFRLANSFKGRFTSVFKKLVNFPDGLQIVFYPPTQIGQGNWHEE